MSFHEKLKNIRIENSLSQDEFANELFVTRQAVSKWENGKGYPDIEKILVISKKYNISLDFLFQSELDKKDINYSNASIYKIIDSALNNMTPFQKTVFSLILIFLLLSLVYNFGTYIGKFLYYVTH